LIWLAYSREEETRGWRKVRKTSCFVFFAEYNYGDPIKEDETGGAYVKCGEQEKCIESFGVKPRKK
jgi:hypothetical protein